MRRKLGDLETRLNGPVRERQKTPDHVDVRRYDGLGRLER